MLPEIFGIETYQIINLLAVIIGIIYITIGLKCKHKIFSFITATMFIILGFFFARLLWASYDMEVRFNARHIFILRFGLMDLGGAFAAFPITVFIAHKLFKIDYRNLLNTMIEGTLLISAISKLACFCGGCCYGKPTDLPWAIINQRGQLSHPVQLYESIIWWCCYTVTMLTKNKMNNINRVCLITIGCLCVLMPVQTLRIGSKMFTDGMYWIVYKIILVLCTIGLIINNRQKIQQLYSKIKNAIKEKRQKALSNEKE